MAFKKGISGNIEGKPKGSVNKTTLATKEIIANFVDKNIANLQKDYDKLEPRERLIILEKLLKFVIPTKVANTDNDGEIHNDPLKKLIESGGKISIVVGTKNF